MKTKVKEMYFVEDNNGLKPIYILADGRKIERQWNGYTMCHDFVEIKEEKNNTAK